MATTSSPTPMLLSVLTLSHETNDDFVSQLRTHLSQIESNVQETLNKIQRRTPFAPIGNNPSTADAKARLRFFDVLKDAADHNNLPFDERFFRQQFLEKHESPSSPKVDVVRARPSLNAEVDDRPHLSPVNHARRSQFAPVLSSTPVHQTSPITPIPVDLTMATPAVAPVLTITSNDLPAVPPSAIVPQRANVTRPAGRPPRIPRGESATRQKKDTSPIREQEEETTLAKEVQVTSTRRIRAKKNMIEENVEVIIEQRTEVMPDVIKQVQATPLRGRKKKIVAEDAENIPQLEPPPPPPPLAPTVEVEEVPKKTRAARGKKKDEDAEAVVKPKRTASSRSRKKQDEVEEEKEAAPVPPKKPTRSKKLVETVVVAAEESAPPPAKVRATPSRGKKKSPVEIVVLSPPEPTPSPLAKKTTATRSKKRKDADGANDNPADTIQPPSPKRRGGRNTKTTAASPQPEPQAPASTRSSRRGKKEADTPLEQQESIVLNKKSRTARGKKANEPNAADAPVAVVDVVMTSVTVSASTTTSRSAKPPRPPVARKKKSIAMPPLPHMSPSTPPASKRIPSTSPINDKPLLPIPVPTSGRRRRQQPRQVEEATLDVVPSVTRNPKRTQSSAMNTPKRARREDLLLTTVPGTPGKKRIRCTCEKRRHRVCDICASAIDA